MHSEQKLCPHCSEWGLLRNSLHMAQRSDVSIAIMCLARAPPPSEHLEADPETGSSHCHSPSTPSAITLRSGVANASML